MKPRDPTQQPSFEERWRQRFESFGRKGEDDAAIAGWSTTGLETRLRNFAAHWAGDQPGALWLDAGCGAGTYSRFMAEHGMRVVAMDYSAPTIVKARDRSATVELWCAADVTCLPVKAGSLDGALCFGVIQALSASERAVSELAAAVRDGGQIWIDALNSWSLPSVWDRVMRKMRGMPPHLRYESAWKLKRIMRAHGLTELRLFWLPILPARWQGWQWLLETPMARFLMRWVPLLGAIVSHAFVLSGRKAI